MNTSDPYYQDPTPTKPTNPKHNTGEAKLRAKVRALFTQIDDNARPMQELLVKSIEEDWDEDRVRAETVKLIKAHMLDVRKNYDYYTDQVMSLIATRVAEARLDSAIGALGRVKYRLPNPNNNVEEWRGHNLGLSQAISVVDEELAQLQAERNKGQVNE